MSYLGSGIIDQINDSPKVGGKITFSDNGEITKKNTVSIVEVDYASSSSKTITIALPKISAYLLFNSISFVIKGLSKSKSNNKLIITCDSSDNINKSDTKSITFSNVSNDQKYTLEHDRSDLWRNIVQNTNSTKGFGELCTIVPDGTDLLEFFKGAPSGMYRLDGSTTGTPIYNDTLGLPYINYWYDVIVTSHELAGYKTLTFLGGSDGSIMVGSITGNVWSGFSSSGVPAGTPIPYPGSTAPMGYLLLNGGSFDTTKFKMLAKLFPTGVLPDLRGEFIRGWDNGRGVDSGRVLLSAQDGTSISNYHGNGGSTDGGSPAVAGSPPKNWFFGHDGAYLISSGFTSFGDLTTGPNGIAYAYRTRSRNIAFNYIIRAL